MAAGQPPHIHPTAIISPDAELAENVQIGAYCILEGKVRLGPGCILAPQVRLCGPLTMGRGNKVYTGAILGERPQHFKYNDEPTSVEIGDENIFREHVTVHRGTTHSMVTRIGSNNFFMVNSHIAHDCVVGNRCILANGALVAGHCILEDQVYLSGNAAVHQHMRIGRLALLSGTSSTTKDMPPFVIQQGFNCVVGINVVGMKRSGMPAEEIRAVHRAFRVLFRQGRPTSEALLILEREFTDSSAVAEMVTFIRNSTHGINGMPVRGRDAA